MRKSLLFVLLLAVGSHLRAADYYWVGGGGNWSDLNHWRLGSSGGPIPSIVPGPGDNVFFDASSAFGTTAPAKTVTLDANGFCNNMTWGAVPNSPTFITANATFTVQLQGNLSLNATTTYQSIFAFKGATAATLTTNGTVLGQFGVEIDKPGSSLTVTDSLIVPAAVNTGTNFILFTSGTFNIAGKKVKVYGFSSDNNNVRTLEMTNADLTVNSGTNSGYHYTGTGKTLNAAGSTMNAFGYWSDGGTYNKVTVTSGSGANTIRVNNSTYTSLTFTPSIGGSIFSHIGSNNTVDTLVFNGIGAIGYNYGIGNVLVSNNNTVGIVKYAQVAQINGTGNVIGKIECLDNLIVNAGSNNNTVDSLILAPNHSTNFNGTFNINDYLYVAGASCDAYTEISGDSVAGTVNFASGAVVNISNVILTGVKATGPVTPIAVNGIDGGGNTGFTITEPTGTGTTFYWVGGPGDWNDKNHWSATSGGSGGVCVPFKNDNVVFDANSGLTGGTVTTSSSSFCNDMTWAAGVGTVTFNESATSAFRAYGSVVLRSTVTMNAGIEFYGSSAASVTTNGSTLGNLQLNVTKTGGGSLTLTDNWSNAAGYINFNQGALSMAGRTVSIFRFYSRNNLTRNLDISNATVTVTDQWHYYGLSRLMTAAGSHITSQGYFVTNAPSTNYPWVDITYAGTVATGFDISSTTFGQLTFTATAATSAARISNSNTIRRLEFKGAGAVTSGGNNIDSLILAGSRNYAFTGTNTVNQYFKAQATPCSGLTEMRGSPTGTLAFGNTAIVQIANVYLQNMTATGTITPISFNGADAGGNTGWTINSTPGSPRYWIGASGDWNDPLHWSTTSGGTGGACVPIVSDDVYFDAASGFTAGNKTVTINNGNAYARNISWAGATNSPTWSKSASWAMEVWGDSIIVNPAATFSVSPVTVKGANAAYLKGGAPAGNFDVRIEKISGSLTLLNSYNNNQTDFVVVDGAFNAPGLTVNVNSVDNFNLANVSSIDISNATINAALWRYAGTVANHSLNAANSTINANTIIAAGLQYDTVNVSGILSSSAIIASTTINRLTFTDPNTASAVGINGASNVLGTVEYKGSGGVYGTGNTINTLMFFPGKIYTFTAGTTTNITNEWFASGTPCNLTEIVSSSTTANATINKTGGAPEFDYIRVRRITATGSTPFVGFNHTIDQGNNTNWSIAPYNGAAPIYGLGPDTLIAPTDFPYTLRTDGFFGSPSSQYTWNDNSTADSLAIPGPGTYSVDVSFVDGCSLSDQITIGYFNPLPLTLVDFSVHQQECNTRLSWKIADAAGLSHFVVERSTDGRHFTAIATVPYTDVADYVYTDPAPENGMNHYRLKLVDAGAQYAYSKTVSINSSCELNAVKVFPTVTSGRVQIVLPQGYAEAKIELYNISGQPVNMQVGGSGTSRTIDLDGFPAATYVLRVINGNEVKSFKVQKQ